MTFSQTVEVLRIVKAEWPNSFRGMSAEDANARVHLWAELFADDDAGLVGAALKAIIVAGNREFAPNIGAIKEKMREIKQGGADHTEAEVWTRIHRAIRNGIYDSEEEFAKLPPILKKVVGSAAQLRAWAMVDSDHLNTVVASNVQRAYRTIVARENEAAKLPEDVRKAIAGFAGRFAMESGREALPGARDQADA